MARLSLCVLLCSLCTGSYAQASRPGTAWYEAGHVLLAVTEPAVGLSGSWQFDRADNGDMRIVKEEQRLGTVVKGSVMMICSDSAMLTRGLAPVKGRETRELDGPVLLLQLALRLLERGLPQGPQAVAGETAFDVRETELPIRVRRGNMARSEFLPPWRAQGKVAPVTPGQIRFEMKFAYSTLAARDRQFQMDLVGVWQRESRVAAFEQDTSISDWQVFRVDAVGKNVAGNFLIDQVAALQARRYQTLGELRTMIERNWDPRQRTRVREECAP